MSTVTIEKVNRPVKNDDEPNVFKLTVWHALIAATKVDPFVLELKLAAANQARVAAIIAPHMYLSAVDSELKLAPGSKTRVPFFARYLKLIAASWDNDIGGYKEQRMLRHLGKFCWVPDIKHPRYSDYVAASAKPTFADKPARAHDFVIENQKQAEAAIAAVNAFFLTRSKTKHLSSLPETFSQRVIDAAEQNEGRPSRKLVCEIFKIYNSKCVTLEDLGWLDRNNQGRDVRYTWDELEHLAAFVDSHNGFLPTRRKKTDANT